MASPKPPPFQSHDILVPMTDRWDAQSIITVIDEQGRLRFWMRRGEDLKILDQPPPGNIYRRPAPRTVAFADIQRVENVVAGAIAAAGGKLKLAKALERIRPIGLSDHNGEGILRYLVGRGDFVATVSPKRTAVSLALSEVGRARENHRIYASSFGHEIGIQAEQIGRLVGHGPTVGGQREELLRALIERHVPQRFHVATGFIEGSPRQIDIMIYDQIDYAPLFRAGNLVVVPIEAVRALIEVKSLLTSDELIDALQHLDDAIGPRDCGPPIFRGIFGYKGAKASILIAAIEDHHCEPQDLDDAGRPVYSIYEMADAVCVLRECILITNFFLDTWDSKTAPRPGIAELASEAGRDTQGALFFDRLLRFLRHPFDGPLTQTGLAARFAVDVESRSISLLYAQRNWGSYMIDAGIERVEAQISAYHTWLEGGSWQEAPPASD